MCEFESCIPSSVSLQVCVGSSSSSDMFVTTPAQQNMPDCPKQYSYDGGG